MRPRLALPLGKPLRLPDLELEALPDEHRRVGDAGIGAKLLRQDHAAVGIDLEDAALAVKGGGKGLVVVGKGLERLQPLGDGRLQPGAAGIDRRTVERGIAIEPVLRLRGPARRGMAPEPTPDPSGRAGSRMWPRNRPSPLASAGHPLRNQQCGLPRPTRTKGAKSPEKPDFLAFGRVAPRQAIGTIWSSMGLYGGQWNSMDSKGNRPLPQRSPGSVCKSWIIRVNAG